MHVLHGRPQISHADGKTHPHARANCRCNVQSPPAFAALRVMIKKRAAVTAISTFSSRHFCAAFAHELRPIKPRYAGKNLRYVRSYEVPKNETSAPSPSGPAASPVVIAPAPRCSNMRKHHGPSAESRRTADAPGPNRNDAPPGTTRHRAPFPRLTFLLVFVRCDDDVRWQIVGRPSGRTQKPYPVNRNERILFWMNKCAALD